MKQKSWRTTTAAVAVAIAALATAAAALIDGDPSTGVNVETLTAAIMGAAAALGLWSARDERRED